ncbi:DUF2637 domain-containing protein [Actinomadura welshii]|uniref:DUF2637 domain-containing protein n=1 Tax=Actinomadura welshii TaxID=3103817 RepID=UPI0003AD5FAA|nr:DUF2637 domain-containing protein [Actinomadura madurae]
MTTLDHRMPASLGAPARSITRLSDTPTAPAAVLDGAEVAAQQTSPRGRALTSSEFTAVAVVAALVGVLGLLGFVNSFAAVAEASRPSFGGLAWTVPLGIDLGIAIFAALDIVLARLDMRIRWLRFIPWALTAATVYLNVAGEHGTFGKVAHAVLPALWVIAVEIAAHVIRIRAGIAAGTRMDGIRAARWILAPWPTMKLWRRMVLWEIRSYPDALSRERARLLALTDLQDTYGRWAWRRRAPRRVRALYRLGELATAEDTGTPSAARSDEDGPAAGPVDRPALESGPSTPPIPGPSAAPSRTRTRTTGGQSARRAGGPSARRSRKTTAPPPDVDDLMPTGRRIAADLAENGQALTRNALAVRLREAGHSAGNARVGALLARLKTEPADPSDAEDAAVPSPEGDPKS